MPVFLIEVLSIGTIRDEIVSFYMRIWYLIITAIVSFHMRIWLLIVTAIVCNADNRHTVLSDNLRLRLMLQCNFYTKGVCSFTEMIRSQFISPKASYRFIKGAQILQDFSKMYPDHLHKVTGTWSALALARRKLGDEYNIRPDKKNHLTFIWYRARQFSVAEF